MSYLFMIGQRFKILLWNYKLMLLICLRYWKKDFAKMNLSTCCYSTFVYLAQY